MKPLICSVATANPDLYLTQAEAYRFYDEHGLMPDRQQALYSRLLQDSRIQGRYFGMDDPREILDETPDAQIARFTEHGRKIAAQACRTALDTCRLTPADLGGVVANTCTGYLCPGMTSYLAEDLGLRNDVKAIDIMGMGCGAAIPNLECGCGMLHRTSGRPVICVCVEICSATHLIDDDPGLTVSNAIFGDGAAAVVLRDAADAGNCNGPVLLDFETGLFPRHREALRYRSQAGHLRNVLTPRVPRIGARCLEQVTRRLLSRHTVQISDIRWWAVHAGGTEVLRQVAAGLDLSFDRLEVSNSIFERYGNMSSPTVLFALKELMDRGQARGLGLILAFGAGFTAFAALADGGMS